MRYMVDCDATSGALGKNLADGKDWEKKNYDRKLVACCLVGSTAAEDCEVEIYFGSELVAVLKNFFTSDLSKTHWIWNSSRLHCFANTPVIVKVTNAVEAAAVLGLEFRRVRRTSSYRRGYSSYRRGY